MIILSILIPTIPSRNEQFTKLFNEVHRQVAYMDTVHPTLGQIEVSVNSDPAFLDGGPSIGEKRERLVKSANGKYLCFLDDDESIAPNYVEVLVRLCNENKDVCTFRNISKLDNYWMVVRMGLHNYNEQAGPGIINRPPWHICPVRSKYAKLHSFPYTNYGEDWAWFEQVLAHCETEAFSNAILHQYNHSVKTSEADKITNNALTK